MGHTATSGPTPALAADGKRIRGTNRRTGEGKYFETVTLVTHEGRPLAAPFPRRPRFGYAAAGAATDSPRTRWRSIRRCTSPLALASSTNSRRNAAPRSRGRGVPTAC